MLKRNVIPAYPQNYEFWYTYASGVNEDLNRRVNGLLRNGSALKYEDTIELYNQYINNPRLEKRVQSVSGDISQRITDISSLLSKAIDTTGDYSGSLRGASETLSGSPDSDALQMVAEELLTATQTMMDQNQSLEDKFKSSQSDIQQLQAELDAARRDSMLDPLTRISNRKGFDQRMQEEIDKLRKNGQNFCLIFADIDHFKQFNDNHGHQTGDQVLRLVGATLNANLKGADLAARYGGEEFAVILPATELKGAVALAEKIREAIQARQLIKRSTNEKLGRVTMSLGVALSTTEDSARSIVERADQCLYAAKHGGRNRVVTQNSREHQNHLKATQEKKRKKELLAQPDAA